MVRERHSLRIRADAVLGLAERLLNGRVSTREAWLHILDYVIVAPITADASSDRRFVAS